MDHSAIAVIETCAHDSHAGTASFPAIVMALAQAGVQSYFADYRNATTTYYLADDSCHAVSLPVPAESIARLFDAAALQAAIRGSQRGELKYPGFLGLSMQAGCVGYSVWIKGRHVSYCGRNGEVHVERFPD